MHQSKICYLCAIAYNALYAETDRKDKRYYGATSRRGKTSAGLKMRLDKLRGRCYGRGSGGGWPRRTEFSVTPGHNVTWTGCTHHPGHLQSPSASVLSIGE